MPSKDTKEKKNKVAWASGRGGAGNIHKPTETGKARRCLVDTEISKPRKMLEVETARNRSTHGGRGGFGNKYHHVLEPGVFQRVIDHETVRIVAKKSEEQVKTAYKPEEWPESFLPGSESEESTYFPRPFTRLRSGSISTSFTSGSGSSASPTNFFGSSSSLHSFSRSISAAPLPKMASKLLSSFKRRFSKDGDDGGDDDSERSFVADSGSIDVPLNPNPSSRSFVTRLYEERSPMHSLPVLPYHDGHGSSIMTTRQVSKGSSKLIPPTPSAPPRVRTPNVQQDNDRSALNPPWASTPVVYALSEGHSGTRPGKSVRRTGPKHPALAGNNECALDAAEIEIHPFTNYHFPLRPNIDMARHQQNPSGVRIDSSRRQRREAVVYI